MINSSLKLAMDTYIITVGELPEATLEYLVANGFSQAMRDAAASAAANVKNRWAKERGMDTGMSVADFRKAIPASDMPLLNAEVEAEAKRLRDAKFAALVSGEIEVRAVGPRANTVEAEVAKVVSELTRAWLAKRGIKYPAGKGAADAVRAYETEFLVLPGVKAKVEKEGQRRYKVAQEMDDTLAGIL